MVTPAGSAGYPVVGDKSLEFYRDANAFVDRRIAQYDSPIFLTRILNKPTVCVASNNGCREVLCDQSHHIELGYRALMEQVYGDNILFYEGDDAQRLRTTLHSLFSPDKVANFQATIDSLTEKAIQELKKGDPESLYDFFKKLTTEICLSIFLDVDFEKSPELAEDIVNLTTLQWHGIISVPTTLKVPMMQKSGYGKALEAKNRLLEIINKKLSDNPSGFPGQVAEAKFSSSEVASGNLLLFTSALVPKALASILTSFVIALSEDESLQDTTRYNEKVLDSIILEVQRLWPPFVGGRRLVRQDCSVEGFHVPKGHAIIYLTRHAQRDPKIFDDPDEFKPERWENKNRYDKDKLFLFGAGPRCCVGRELVKRVLKTATRTLLQQYSWACVDGKNGLKYKWLPVSRPTDEVKITFTHLGPETPL